MDCEMVALDETRKKVLPLDRIPDTHNHILVVFDILQLNNFDWRDKEYTKRKSKLEELFDSTELRQSGIYLPREKLAQTLADAKTIMDSFFAQSQFEGVILKVPNGKAKTGASSYARGRLKPYTVLDSVLIGYNETKKSFLVGLWKNSEKRIVMPYRNVEGIEQTCKEKLDMLFKGNLTKKRPAYIGPGPVPTWYVRNPMVVAVKCDGFIIPNRQQEFATEWILHEGATIAGIYPVGEKEANTLSYLYNLRKRNEN